MEIDVLNLLVLSFFKLWFLLSLAAFLSSQSRNTCASSLHALLLLALLGAALMPLLVGQIPALQLLLLPTDFPITFYWSYSAGQGSKIFTLLGSAYLLIVAWLWLRRLIQIRRARRLLHSAKMLSIKSHQRLLATLCDRLNIRTRVRLRYTDHIATPLTLGDLQPWILLPRESVLWDEHRLRRFLLHELAHIARHDWFAKQFSYMVAALFWIVPTVWHVLFKLEWLAELSCDDVVIEADGRRSDYANDLLDVTASRVHVGVVGLIENHSHYERIAAVLDGTRIRQGNPIKFSFYALIFLLTLLVLAGIQVGHMKLSDENSENHKLIPLVVLDNAVQPSTSKGSDAEEIIRQHNLVTDAPPPVLPPSVPVDPLVEFEAAVPLNNIWNSAGGDVIQPLIKVAPSYPRKALQRGREGVVEVTFDILSSGETAHIQVQRAQPAGVFEKAAMDAVRQYRYAPQLREIHGVSEVFEFRLLEDAP